MSRFVDDLLREFPDFVRPESRRFDAEVRFGLDVLKSVVGREGAAYVAGPLDTGWYLYDALDLEGLASQDALLERWGPEIYRARIREPNEAAVRTLVDRLRRKGERPVIDPGLLKVSGWTWSHYSRFFLEVVRELVAELWFVDGWEFSSGATKELVVGIALDIPCLDSAGVPLLPSRALKCLARAIARIEERRLPADTLHNLLAALKRVLAAG